MLRKLFAWIRTYERHLSAAAMVAGAVVDQLFFERIDLWETQAVFASYALVCFVSIPLLHWCEAHERHPRWRMLLPLATQFALGGFWSGFLVFYGRAAVLSASWPFLLFLVLILIGNEYFSRYHERLVFTSVLFFIALYFYAIFAVPVLAGAMGTATFLLSGVVAIALFALFTVLLRVLGRARFRRDVWRVRVGAFAALFIVNLFYFTNVLPPLPLAAKAAGIYHAVARVPDGYVATSEREPWQVRYFGAAPTLHVIPGESLYAYSAIFAPTALATTIVHRWQWYDPEKRTWVTKAAIAYPIEGGRDGGYRGYSATLIPEAGRWRVNIETVGGLVIARLPFMAVQVQLPPPETTALLKK